MEEWVFYLSVAVAASSVIGFIILSVVGSIIEKRIKDKKTYEKAGWISTIIAFILFLALGFSMVPVMIGLFFPLLQKVVPVDISALQQNDMICVFGAWAVYLIGLAIAFPAIKKDFFTPAKMPDETAITAPLSGSGPSGAKAAGRMTAGERRPGLTWPPLDHQIKEAGAIVLAQTEKSGDAFTYTVLEIWKGPKKGFSLKTGMPAPYSTKFFELQGYAPVERQLVVFFITDKPPYDEPMELLPVVGSYVMYAPADTTVQEYLELGELKKRVVGPSK